jgi:uncharacterized protein (TIGR02246 family)
MPAKLPEEVHVQYAEFFSARDLDGLLSLYEPGASFLRGDGEIASGHAAIRQTLSGILARNGRMSLEVRKILRAGDLALLISDWTIAETGVDGEQLSLSGRASDVVRQQPDGSWLIVIDNPHGANAVRVDGATEE